VGSRDKAPVGGLGYEVLQKLVICKLNYDGVLSKKAKQYFVSLALQMAVLCSDGRRVDLT